MKIFTNDRLLKTGNAGLRCGHWAMVFNKKNSYLKKWGRRMLGYHEGKYFAYLFILVDIGWSKMFPKKPIIHYKKFLKDYYKGWIWIYPKLTPDWIIILKKDKFEQILNFPAPENSRKLVKQMRKMCKII